jgi:hypothetical protein
VDAAAKAIEQWSNYELRDGILTIDARWSESERSGPPFAKAQRVGHPESPSNLRAGDPPRKFISPIHTTHKEMLFMAGVRYARQEVAAAVGHGGGCKFFAFRGTPLGHGGIDGCRPLVDAFGIGVVNDQAAGGRC